MKKQIIAIGGAGFTLDKRSSSHDAILSYFIQQTKKHSPKVCVIPTASGESQNYIVSFYEKFLALGCQPTHLSLFSPRTAELESLILSQDAIYVGGGNTCYLDLKALKFQNHILSI